MSDYPEHDRLTALGGKNEVVGDFIEWLGENRYEICERGDMRLFPVSRSTSKWIAEYFDIDQRKLDAEKRQMLDKLREMNS